jgi:hypothetical protein
MAGFDALEPGHTFGLSVMDRFRWRASRAETAASLPFCRALIHPSLPLSSPSIDHGPRPGLLGAPAIGSIQAAVGAALPGQIAQTKPILKVKFVTAYREKQDAFGKIAYRVRDNSTQGAARR